MSHPRRQHADAELQSLASLPSSPLHSSQSTRSLSLSISSSSLAKGEGAGITSPPHNPVIARSGSGGTTPTLKHSRSLAQPQAPAVSSSDLSSRAPSFFSSLRSRPGDQSHAARPFPPTTASLSLPLSPTRLIAHSEFPSPPIGIVESSTSPFFVSSSSDSTAAGRSFGGTPQQSTLASTRTASATSRINSSQRPGHARAPVANSIHVSAMAENTGHRMMPRTSSIDSAISSLSSASHSHKSSLDANNVTPADIANLISAAGSPEAVIIHLLKEKQHAAIQNAQLWKLLEKQRKMLLALNKDLERAMKEKEKYRKRLKEVQNTPLPLSLDAKKDYSKNSEDVQSRDTRSRETNRPEDSQHNVDLSNEFNSSPVSQGTDTDHQTPTDSNPDTASRATDSPESQLPLETRANANRDATSQQDISSQHAVQVDKSAAEYGIFDTSKSPGFADKAARIPPPARKPPPAPLKLDEARKVRPHILLDNHKANSDSEYDEILDDSEIPTMERGRRKTREEDDRLREAILLKEQEIRSRSSKKKLKHFEPPENVQKEQTQTFLGVGLPASPRSAMSGSPSRNPPGIYSPPPASISAILQPGARDHSLSDKSRMTSPLSPGLPQSPRPADRPLGSPMPRFPKDPGSLASPPISPPILTEGQFQNMMIPASPSPAVSRDDGQEKGEQVTGNSPDKPENEVPTYKLTVEKGSPVSALGTSHTIYHGLVSAEYPDLLLPPSALPSIDVQVSSSRLRPSRSSYLALRPIEEEPVFTLSIRSRGSHTELWRVEKAIIALPQLDHQVKQLSNFNTKLPERSIFTGHSPAKVDARRMALNAYFESLLTHPMDEATALVVCEFLTADAIEPRDDESNLLHGPGNGKPPISFGPDGKPRMEGYLTKRGKNFGGWKSRYFVLNGPELRYYESPGGPHLGTIKIQHAQIGKQSPSGKSQSPSRTDDDSDNQYRHAFLVLEPKKRDTSALVRHVLCAESDKERDMWVETLLCYVEPREIEDESHGHNAQTSRQGAPKPRLQPGHPRKGTWENSQPGPAETLQALSYDDVIAAEAPVRGPGGGKVSPSNGFRAEHADRHPEHDNSSSPTHKAISGPTNAMRIQDAGAWGNKTVTSTKEKKRSIWGFRAATGADFAGQGMRQDSVGSLYDDFLDRKGPIRPVFGLPLADAVVFCGPPGLDCGLPAVVFRCLQYLRAQNAQLEEGIFRLSGSNVVIKALKERFNTEGDLNFLDGDSYYDVHAVASLFKQYLRELPTTVLTKELHIEFIRVLDLDDRQQKIMAFHILVRRLPRPNLDLLKALSQFLIVIINNADVNKMTVRNVGIVFAPTLNIPAPVFAMFLTEFDAIFGDDQPATNATRQTELVVNSQRLNPEDIRSPRHQMFSDLPTPAYDRHSFDHHRMGTREDSKHRDARGNHNTGFIPMHPTYEPPPIPHQQSEESSHPHLRSMTNFLTSGNQTTKSKRRESSILFM